MPTREQLETARIVFGELEAEKPRARDRGALDHKEPPPHDHVPDGPNGNDGALEPQSEEAPTPLVTITPAAWKDTKPPKERWFASSRIPGNDLSIFTGNGGAGKTEIALQLCIYGAAGLGDWLGCTIENGGRPTMFYSAEEQEPDVRKRFNRICEHRGITDTVDNLHFYFPDLEDTFLVTVDRNGRLQKTPLWVRLEATITPIKPRLVVIDNVAAVFDGEAISRRQVRRFCSMLRKMARMHDTAIVLLDHPSLRGMSDGSGTSNSVDWRNGPRAMLYLSDPDQDDPDARTLEVKKLNDGRQGEKVKLRWNGLTFTTEAVAGPSPQKIKAEREIDELFLRLLDKLTAQGRVVRSTTGSGYAPSEFEADPEANGVKSKAFKAAMGRLFTTGQIVTIEGKRSKHIERVGGNQ